MLANNEYIVYNINNIPVYCILYKCTGRLPTSENKRIKPSSINYDYWQVYSMLRIKAATNNITK